VHITEKERERGGGRGEKMGGREGGRGREIFLIILVIYLKLSLVITIRFLLSFSKYKNK